MNKWRLLVSARDPGAAGNLYPIVREALQADDIELYLAAQEPALDWFRRKGLNVETVSSPPLATINHPGRDALLDEAERLLKQVQADVVLTGLSGPGIGIDEALLARADVPTFALQDFWGDVNKSFGVPADCYLVRDDEAAQLSQTLHRVDSIVVGSPKYVDLCGIDSQALGDQARRRLQIDDQIAEIGLFGQPLWQHSAYRETLAQFAEALSQAADDFRLIYRPHPKETAEEIEQAMCVLGAHTDKLILDQDGETLSLIAACDVVASAFSSCCLDLIYLQRCSQTDLGTALYLLFHPAMRAVYQQYTGMDHLPPVNEGLALQADSREELVDTLRQALSPEVRGRLHRSIDQVLPLPEKVVPTVLHHLRRAAGALVE